MKKRSSKLRLTAVLFTLIAAGATGVWALGVQAGDQARADLIVLDSLQKFGALDKPVVTFVHDLHTMALAKKKKDCSTCHLRDENTKEPSPKFKRWKDVSKKQTMNVYHDNCIACHQETKAGGEKTGPVKCSGCHLAEPTFTSSRVKPPFDRSLHFRHSKGDQKTCGECHHQYDQKTQKTYYKKGAEDSCRYCHGETTAKKGMSMRLASHLSCVKCHGQKLQDPNFKDKDKVGPITCGGCHDAKEIAKIKIVKDVPRLKRGQPDVALVRTGMQNLDGKMPAVPFDHKAHEKYNPSCTSCHHAALTSCASCHTLTGAKEGKFVNLALAMHQESSQHSCLGCHSAKQKSTPECAGCHKFMAAKAPSEASCATCHRELPAGVTPLKVGQGESEKAWLARRKARAGELLEARPKVTGTFAQEALPEKVKIAVIAKEYQPVEFPHRKIVNALVQKLDQSPLAAYFHKSQGSLCQGCHHNSPAAKKPPRCANCHARPFDERLPSRPGMKAAYHQQCMDCHQAMKLKKPVATDCVSCHPKKK